MKKLLLLLIIVAALAGGVYYAGEQGWLADTPLKNFNHRQLNIFQGQNTDQLKTLTERTQQASEQVQNVLGQSIEVNDQEESITTRTFEYARYLYCQQVVKDWEKNHSNNN